MRRGRRGGDLLASEEKASQGAGVLVGWAKGWEQNGVVARQFLWPLLGGLDAFVDRCSSDKGRRLGFQCRSRSEGTGSEAEQMVAVERLA